MNAARGRKWSALRRTTGRGAPLPVMSIIAGLLFGTVGALALVTQPQRGHGGAPEGLRSSQATPACPGGRERTDHFVRFAVERPGSACGLGPRPQYQPVRQWSA